MVFSILVGLYTSRVVLNTLGVSDYGVYNVVGGIVAMLSFLNSALTASSQRFISYELGKGNINKLNNVFCTSVSTHLALAGIIFFIAETIGLWFINTHLNIDANRIVAANWVYQCSILSFILTVVSVPYNSCIVAHEHMNAFAYISILETLLKLLIVYILLIISYDKLIVYAILTLCVAIIIRTTYGIYCKSHFKECTYHYKFDKKLFKDMFAFAGWSIVGNLGFSFKDQASNIILNIFFGTIVNAARGIALQVSGIIYGFSSNFMMALNPQITKRYAAGDINGSISLVYAGCRYSFFLLALIVIPVLININYLLFLWLGSIPQYTVDFLRLALIAALINSMAQPLVTALQATGNIKIFQITICCVMLSELPMAYFILKFGGEPYMAMYPTVLVVLIGLFARFIILKHLVPAYNLYYFISLVVKNLILGIFCYIISYYIHSLFQINFKTFILTSVLSYLSVFIMVYIFGITSIERDKFNKKVCSIIRNIRNRENHERY